jgi:hypothetical protein
VCELYIADLTVSNSAFCIYVFCMIVRVTGMYPSVPNMSRSVLAMLKTSKLRPDGGDSDSEKYSQGCNRVWRHLHLAALFLCLWEVEIIFNQS